MCKQRIRWVVLGLALGLLAGLPCVQAADPNAPALAKATSPRPADGATDVFRDGTVLTWTGTGADEYDVYLGTSREAVEQADQATVQGVTVSLGQKATKFEPGRLELSQTYFWRVDQVKVGATDPNAVTIAKGDVWSFTVELAVLPIQGVKATASCSIYDNMGPDKTVDGSGLEGDLHSTDMTAMWLTCYAMPNPDKPEEEINWIQFEFDKVYKLSEMWVWNWNGAVEKLFGLGAKDVTIKYSTNGTDWTVLGDLQFAKAPGAAGYAHNTVVDLGGVAAKFVRIVIKTSQRGYLEYGLSEVRFFYVPVFPTEPKPASGTKGVPLNGVLSWRAGREAASHKVYISTDKQAVTKGTVAPKTTTTNSFNLGPLNLELDKTYYWKVEEVSGTTPPEVWAGDVWSFTTIDYLVVDDFESYTNNLAKNWRSEYSSGTSSIDKNVVHSGQQALALNYNNANNPFQVVAGRRFSSAQDWTVKGVKKLVIFFHGDLLNKDEPLFVIVNGSKVVYSGGIINPWWNSWSIDIMSLGIDPRSIEWMTVGVGPNALSKGKLYIDDIRLYQKTPSVPDIVNLAFKLNGTGATKGQFDTFLAALLASDAKVLESLSSEEVYTVFAPSDDACAAVGIGIKEVFAMDRAVLTAIVQYHIAAGKIAADHTGEIKTVQGTPLQQAGKELTDSLGGKAKIVGTAEGSNGVLHAIDAVLMPFKM